MFKKYIVKFGDEGGARFKSYFSLRKAINYAVDNYDESPWIYIDPIKPSKTWNRLYLKVPNDKHYNIWLTN